MTYISTIRKKDKVLVWERNEKGSRVLKTYDAPYYFFYEHEDGDYTSIFDTKLIKVTASTNDEFKSLKERYKSKGYRLFESDISAELKIISKHYYQAKVPKLHNTYYDIEVDVDYEKGFPRPHDPHSPLNSVSIYNDWENRMVVYSVPPEGQKYTSLSLRKQMEEKEAFPTGIDIDIEVVKSERDLLRLFIEEIRDSDNILGWNSTRFDNPYIAKRIEKVLGKKYHEMLCFDHAYSPKYKEIESFGAKTPIVMLSGRIASDYMDLFKKYDPVERSSYKLASMADEILPDLPKLQYSGTLASLYKDDFPFFCRYNLRDTEILKGFEEALGYVALANEIYHMSMSQWRDVTGTIGLTQNTIDNYCIHTLEKRVPDRSSNVPGNISGAYVLRPKVGLHPWVGSVDINSLYPSAIRSINVSTETVLGQFEETEEACVAISEETDKEITFVDENGGKETNTGKEWNKILKENNATVSGYGTVFTQDFKGIIPSVLEEWYDLRKEYQKKKKEAYEKAQEILKKYN